ncbi:type II secretion system F family protein [[Ruminococcus] torques]|uniref:type II secretion system F family protein n=1 Tax=[Ruminococcus] torques TaxID=33039 RepID=UPI0025A44F47|nr:type II secretion system F family protein [[Ruminococcus] torques]MDM8236024.1 type II secretion system F family protein [[Ruminococcus] torques]
MKTETSLRKQDIRKYEYAIGVLKATAATAVMSYVFYDSLIPAPLLLPVWMIYMRDWHDDISRKKEQELRQQFRDSIQVMASALKAGYSVENAIREAGKDISPVYSEETRIRKEFERMERQMDMNMSAEEVLKGFAERTGQEDIENFVNVFAAAKKSGGDSIAVIRDAVKIISSKIDTEKEIQTMIASKKMEFDIMCAVPFAIILYMKLTFGEFLNVLYGNMAGAAIMSLCIFVYMGAYVYGRKIIRIEV